MKVEGTDAARRVAKRVGYGVLLAFACFVGWGLFAPLVSDDEVADATAQITARRTLAGSESCSRPTLGSAEPFTMLERSNAMAALSACLEGASQYDAHAPLSREVPSAPSIDGPALDSVGDPITDAGDVEARDVETDVSTPELEYWGWSLEEGSFDEGMAAASPMVPGDLILTSWQPPTPIGAESPELLAVRAACAPLEAALARAASTGDLCAGPAGLSADLRIHQEYNWLAKAAGLMAQQRWSQGRQSEALSLLENALMTVRDYRRGAVGWVVALSSVAAEGIIASFYASLLNGVIDLSAEEVERHQERLDVIRQSAPSPAQIPLFDHILFGEMAGSDGSARLGLVASVSRTTCGEDAPSPAVCLERWQASEPAMVLPEVFFGLRLFRSIALQRIRAVDSEAAGASLSRLVDADTQLVLLSNLLQLAIARDTCPPAAELEPIAGTAGSSAVRQFRGQNWELVAPDRSDKRFLQDRLVITFACPPALANWGPI